MPALHLLPVGLVDPRLVRLLASELPERFSATVAVDPATAPAARWLAGPGARYQAAAVLADLVAAPPADGGWRLALLDGTLVADGIRSTCGIATIGGCCAVVALGALPPEPAPATTEATFRHALVEAVHEVGHLAGLAHCPDATCVMHFSRDARTLTRKAPDFCDRCRASALRG